MSPLLNGTLLLCLPSPQIGCFMKAIVNFLVTLAKRMQARVTLQVTFVYTECRERPAMDKLNEISEINSGRLLDGYCNPKIHFLLGQIGLFGQRELFSQFCFVETFLVSLVVAEDW